MRKTLKELLDSKNSLCKSQRLFTKTLKDQYPFLILEDSETGKNDLEDELKCLLSSAVKFKTGRLVIKAPSISWRKEVVLTRSPGLKEPYQSYKAFDFIDVKEIDQEGNLLKVKNNWAACGKVMLGCLRKSNQIDQEKLRVFYKFLKEALVWRKNLDKLINTGYKDNKTVISVGEHRIKIHSIDFEIGILRPIGERKYDRFDDIMSDEFKDYATEGKTKISNQEMLMEFWKHFKEFDKALKNAERSKIKLVKQVENLIERLREYNKPFRILLAIKKSSEED